MPNETRNYLPKLQAVKNIVRDPEKYGLVLADIPDAPFFTVVKTTRKIDTKRAAEIAELSLEEFLALNPQHNRPVIAGADEQSILLPIDNAEIFAAKLELTEQPLVSWQAYRLQAQRDRWRRWRPVRRCRWRRCARSTASARARTCPIGHTLLVPAQRPSDEAAATLDDRRVHHGARRPHVLLHRAPGRHAAPRRRALRRHRAGPEDLERPAPGLAGQPASGCG